MSMYSELLSELCADLDPVRLPTSREELVVVLLQCRRRLHAHGAGRGHDMVEDLALELDHDRMLIRLCSAMGIQSDATHFVTPLVERARLEALLRQRGVDFRTLEDNRRVSAV
jgi:hypothetical protein